MTRMRLLSIVLCNSDWMRSLNTKETLAYKQHFVHFTLESVTHTLIYQHSEFQMICTWELKMQRNGNSLDGVRRFRSVDHFGHMVEQIEVALYLAKQSH